ncbi:MAG: tyrosine-type recombinase/integrase [Candidatus Aenigmarchaeota archaeon]|nr:tyrosine-type recombinase/integrase [Candidatus Aenigmarchaeota archaeon]
MNYKIEVHNYEAVRKLQERLLDEADILPGNKQHIRAFISFYKSREIIGESRSAKYLWLLRRIAGLVNKPFKEMDENDMNELLSQIQETKRLDGNPLSPNTKRDFRIAISRFWRWLFYDEYKGEAPPQIRGVKTTHTNSCKEPEIYTKDEIKTIVNGMTTIRDKAFFMCLYDLQCRVGELLSRQIKHIRYNEDGDIQVLIEAEKTGVNHWETLFESVLYFITWLRLHPRPDDPEAPLWTTMKQHGRIKNLTYPLARDLFIKAARRQGIRQLKMHTFRKSKATHDLADGVPITYIEARGSWRKGSRALQDCYLSVQQQDKDNAYKKKYNMKTASSATNQIELKRCKRCESVMEHDAKFCPRCGMPSDEKVLAEQQEISKKVNSLIDADMLSEMVKKVVLDELKRKQDEGLKVPEV